MCQVPEIEYLWDLLQTLQCRQWLQHPHYVLKHSTLFAEVFGESLMVIA